MWLRYRSPPPLFVFNQEIPWNATGRRFLEAALAEVLTTSKKPQGWGFPLMMGGPPQLQFQITPDETLIVNTYSDLRHVYTDGRRSTCPSRARPIIPSGSGRWSLAAWKTA